MKMLNQHTPCTMAAGHHARVRSTGLVTFVHGHPLVKSFRTTATNSCVPINTLDHILRAATHHERDIVMPVNDQLYTRGWIHLADGPQHPTVPAASTHLGRYFVLALYDANAENLWLHDVARGYQAPALETLNL